MTTTAAERRAAEQAAAAEAAKESLATTDDVGDVEDGALPKGKFIKFVGHTGERIISEQDWDGIGVKDHEGKVWSKANAWRIPRREFDDKALNYLLLVDGEFVAEN